MFWRQEAISPPTKRQQKRGRSLRGTPTEAERRFWWHLRHRLPIHATHFRRQVPIGPYFANFCCMAAGLIIEVDGNQHGFDDQIAYDATRTTVLKRQGFKIIRCTNGEVLTEIDRVLDTIFAVLGPTPPTPDPSPQGGWERVSPDRAQ